MLAIENTRPESGFWLGRRIWLSGRSHECERGTQECVRHNHTIINRMRIAIGLTLWLVTAYAASVWDGVYTAEQADRGKALYGKQCASCHGAGLDGSGQ